MNYPPGLGVYEVLSLPEAQVQADAFEEFLETAATKPDEAKLAISAGTVLMKRVFYNDPNESSSYDRYSTRPFYRGPDNKAISEPDETVEGEFTLCYQRLKARTLEHWERRFLPRTELERLNRKYELLLPQYRVDFSLAEVVWQQRSAQLGGTDRRMACLTSGWTFQTPYPLELAQAPGEESSSAFTVDLVNFARIKIQ